MYRNKSKILFLSAGLSMFVWLTGPASVPAQTPSPTPGSTSTETLGGYSVRSSVELGVRGLEVNGDHEKYRSDLNYRAGFRIFDSSFLIEDNTSGTKLFDSALVTASGWGSDPSGSFRLNMDRTGIFKFDSNVRRVRYFNNLKNHATVWTQPVSTGSQHDANTLHHFGDFDLTIFPESDNFRMRLGYSFSDTNGVGGNNLRFQSDEFRVDTDIDSKSDDLRFGVEGKVLGFNLGLNYGHRNYRDSTRFYINEFNVGVNPLPTTASISNASRQFQVKGNTDFVHFFAQRTFANKLDFTGRIIYAESNSDTRENDLIRGSVSATGNIIVLDEIFVPGEAKRPQTRADVGLTYRVTSDFRISNTFTFDQFSLGGGNTLAETIQSTTATGGARPTTFAFSSAWRSTSYRRFSNLIEMDYQFRRWLAFNIGYRYTDRTVFGIGRDVNLVTNVVTPRGDEEHENQTHTIIAGARIKPTKNWSIYADIEKGQSDSVFTRLSNNDFINFRVRSIARFNRFTINVSAISRDGESPGVSTAFTGTVPFAPFDTTLDSKTRVFSGSVDWTPVDRLSFSTGYTYNHQTSRADIIVPIGVPIFPTTRFLQGISEYYVRDSYFHFDISARPIKRLSVYASYRITDDPGQGDRQPTRPQDFITSYPIRYQAPEVRLAIRLARNVDWNIGYQYYDYQETPIGYPFSSISTTVLIPQRLPAQNYSAHLPYTSLRIYFGKGAAER